MKINGDRECGEQSKSVRERKKGRGKGRMRSSCSYQYEDWVVPRGLGREMSMGERTEKYVFAFVCVEK